MIVGYCFIKCVLYFATFSATSLRKAVAVQLVAVLETCILHLLIRFDCLGRAVANPKRAAR